MLQQDYKRLRVWYAKVKRDLPWRQTTDPYAVMVSEFMLQQTTVAAVIPKYLAWMSRFPDVEALANAATDEVLLNWSGLGYYQRARRLHAAAIEVHRMGVFPTTLEELTELPGFGPYTAAALSSICFARPSLAIDTNVIRVLYRYFGLKSHAQSQSAHKELRSRMRDLLELGEPGETNQALMELGATHCAVKGPECRRCPLRRGCEVRASGLSPESYPLPKVKKQIKRTPTMALLLEERASSRVLLVRGTSLGLLSGLHQPPLLFGDEASEHPISKACLRLLEQLETLHSKTWTLGYGISGRRLDLTCVHWRLGREEFRQASEVLKSKGVESVLWSRDNETVALSSLTRKVLSKWLESL